MAYKTILTHLNNEARVDRLTRAAMLMAMPGDAHLTGLFIVPHIPFRSPIFPRLSGSIVQSGLDAYRQSGAKIQQAFEQATKGQPVVADWRLYEPRHSGYAEAVLDHARAAELLIASQKESDWDYADMFDIPDVLALESGRPVLVVPRSGDLGAIGNRVLVAWNNSRESARAVFDALPILLRAKEVRVLAVAEGNKPETGELAGVEISAALARHGVKCVSDHVKPQRQVEPGEMLLTEARTDGCDLIVMGCYGRSRLRELVLGGASRYLLQNTTIPLLLSH